MSAEGDPEEPDLPLRYTMSVTGYRDGKVHELRATVVAESLEDAEDRFEEWYEGEVGAPLNYGEGSPMINLEDEREVDYYEMREQAAERIRDEITERLGGLEDFYPGGRFLPAELRDLYGERAPAGGIYTEEAIDEVAGEADYLSDEELMDEYYISQIEHVHQDYSKERGR